MKNSQSYQQLEQCIDDIQGRGKSYFTFDDIKKRLNLELSAVQKQLQPLLKLNKIALTRKGFYAIVPTEYRNIGAPPVTYYIEGMMKSLNRPYYIGL